jgi:hypothetical protein
MSEASTSLARLMAAPELLEELCIELRWVSVGLSFMALLSE